MGEIEKVIQKRIDSLHNGNVILLEEIPYKNRRSTLAFFCKKHNTKFYNSLNNVLNKSNPQSCRQCGLDKMISKIKSSKEELLQKLYNVHGNTYDILFDESEEYRDKNSVMTFLCKRHNIRFKSPYGEMVYKGRKCPICTTEDKYNTTYTEVNCPSHGLIRIKNIIRPLLCPNCVVEKFYKTMEEIINKEGYKFEKDYIPEEFHNEEYSFSFYIPELRLLFDINMLDIIDEENNPHYRGLLNNKETITKFYNYKYVLINPRLLISNKNDRLKTFVIKTIKNRKLLIESFNYNFNLGNKNPMS